MIVVTITFRLPQPVDAAQMRALSMKSVERYRGMPGLLRKYYVRSEDGQTVGGTYLWNSRAEAEAVYTEAWRTAAQAAYGSAPQITYWDCPVVVDNVVNAVIAPEVAQAT